MVALLKYPCQRILRHYFAITSPTSSNSPHIVKSHWNTAAECMIGQARYLVFFKDGRLAYRSAMVIFSSSWGLARLPPHIIMAREAFWILIIPYHPFLEASVVCSNSKLCLEATLFFQMTTTFKFWRSPLKSRDLNPPSWLESPFVSRDFQVLQAPFPLLTC